MKAKEFNAKIQRAPRIALQQASTSLVYVKILPKNLRDPSAQFYNPHRMNFKRLTSTSDPFFADAMSLYATSFPLFEQRSENSQTRVLRDPNFYAFAVHDENKFIGILFCWQTQGFHYIEHFAISKTLRGQGYGTKVLNAYALGKELVFLEIDPPIDDVSRNRLHFYENQGFELHPYPHIHSAFRLEGPSSYPLNVMSKNGALTEEQFHGYRTYLAEHIMTYSEAHDQ